MERLRRYWVETYSRYREMAVDYLRNRIEYFNNNSTLKVFGHVITLSRIPLIKRTFWLLTLLACFFAAATVLKGALEIYRADAVSFSVETDFLHWDTPFPGVTVCEERNIPLIKEYLTKHNLTGIMNFVKELWGNKGCRTCAACKINKTCVDDFERILNAMRTPCEDFFADCWWNGEKEPCCELFKPIDTQYGQCFAFNSQFNNDEPLKYINRKIGLPALIVTCNVSALIKIHSPREIISQQSETIGSDDCKMLSPRDDLEIILRAEQTYSDISVRSIPKYSRECLLEEELPDFVVNWPFKRYSHYACMWYCLALDQYKVCNCTYHFMPNIDLGDGTVPVCDVAGLRCLYKHKEEVLEESCECPMNCDEVSYEVTHTFCSKLKGQPGDPGKAVIRFGQLPSLKIRRHAIRDMLGLVVDFGGVIGVFFGASLLSFIEIIYIFCIRRN